MRLEKLLKFGSLGSLVGALFSAFKVHEENKQLTRLRNLSPHKNKT
jgi:hypothetical protein